MKYDKATKLEFQRPFLRNNLSVRSWAFEFQAEGIFLAGLGIQKIVVTVLCLVFRPLSGQQKYLTLIVREGLCHRDRHGRRFLFYVSLVHSLRVVKLSVCPITWQAHGES